MKKIILPFVVAFVLSGCAGTDTNSPVVVGDPNPVSTVSASTTCVLSSIQQDMLDEVNRARSQARSCSGQSFPAVEALSWNCALAAAAEGHSEDMAQYSFLEHTGSNGLMLADRIDAQGYNPGTWAENIAEGYELVGDVVQGFLSSPGHCQNIMNSSVTELGAASSQSTSSGQWYWTQVFATPF